MNGFFRVSAWLLLSASTLAQTVVDDCLLSEDPGVVRVFVDTPTLFAQQLLRDDRFSGQPIRAVPPPRLVPILPAEKEQLHQQQQQMPPQQRKPCPPKDDCCEEVLQRLATLEEKLDKLPERATADLSGESIEALADVLQERLKFPEIPEFPQFPDLTNLATSADVSAVLDKLDLLARHEDMQGVLDGQATIEKLLEKIIALPQPPADGGGEDVGDPSLRDLAVLLQRNTQTLTSLTSHVELLGKGQDAIETKLKNVELAIQRQAEALQKLVAGDEALQKRLGVGEGKLNEIQTTLRDVLVRLQRLEAVKAMPLSEDEKQRRVEEMIEALSQVIGGNIKLRLQFNPETGQLYGAERIE